MTTHTEAQLLRAFNAITLGHTFLVRAWDSRDFTRSPGPTKNAFQRVKFPRIKKEEVMGY